MNKEIVLSWLLILCGINLFATHYRGGEITYKIINTYTVEATVTTYTKVSYPSNLADRDSITITWGDGTTGVLPRINGVNDGSCNGASPCGEIIATDIKRNIYVGSHTYASPSPTKYYVIGFFDDNMLGGIANIDNGNSITVPFFVDAVIYTDSNYNSLTGGFDHSPVFLNSPKYYAFVSDTFTFNSTAYDPDGDSLSYALIAPKTSQSNDVPLYIFPDAYCNSQGSGSNNTFNIDAHTGEIKWITPCSQGFFQLAIIVREFRCGAFIGQVVRNMQIIVLPNKNSAPRLSSVLDTIIQPGQLLQFNISSLDSDVADTNHIQVLGEAFLDSLSVNRPVFNGSAGNPASGLFSWQPDVSFARAYAYLFTVVGTDNFMASGPNGNPAPFPASGSKTFRVWVAGDNTACTVSAIDDVTGKDLGVRIFPNPANSVLHVQSVQQFSKLLVYDLTGREIRSMLPNSLNYDLTLDGLENGVYLVSIVMKDLTVTSKFLKIE